MSGLEVAGVVLGSLPLLVVALEHYVEGLSMIKSMQKYEEVFEYLHASFVTTTCIYRNSCEELLSPLALSDARMSQLLEDHEDSSWDDPEFNDALRNRLGNNYLPFRSSVKQLNKKIKLFGAKLQLCDNFQPPWITVTGAVDIITRNKFFKDPWLRIKGGFKSKPYRQLLSSIEEDINRISSLTSGSIALEPLRLQRRRKANAEYLLKFRQQAEKLYDAFNTRWSSRCTCQFTHQANLRLDIQRDDETGNHSKFKLVFTFGTSHAGYAMPWRSIPVEIEAVDVIDTIKPDNRSPLPKIVVHSNEKVHDHWKCLKRAPNIIDLCATLQRCPGRDCIGVMSSKLTKHHIHTLHLPNASTNDQRVSLQQMMATQGATFQIKEKCTLALTLASAVYHLYNTPWLEESWGLDDICILSQSVLSDQPYISRDFPATATPPAHSQRMRIIKNSIIFALGVALLEISYGKPLQTFVTKEDLDDATGNRTTFTEYLIAVRLAEGLRTRELTNYADATQRCIHCNFEASVFSLDDDDFRERFYQGVIMPLRKDYEYVVNA
ncbi:hypothetical protein BKA58DRAFT_465733 [Alternaria rosae]|uniref:uncharacterized protein n=1 Tax=Alternaria rosae TaxID=1187941 RepID=UPI001E8D1268|nr:uncharacterized protein BKA58DRAFT_465733 [Alternaria rosae]KAH6878005.1 hypothetical protein BKA58DRAFT_465733 [Alternaria rosae]